MGGGPQGRAAAAKRNSQAGGEPAAARGWRGAAASGAGGSGGVDAETVITDVSPLSEIQSAFEALDRSPTALKSLIKVGDT